MAVKYRLLSSFERYAIIDVCVVAFGFVLRILAGGYATDIHLSKWIVLMTFLLMLFLSFAKRRDDVVRMNETGHAPRQNTIRIYLTFINQGDNNNGKCHLGVLYHVHSKSRNHR